MSAFTPGPWDYCARLSASENHRGYIVRGKGYIIAEVIPYDSDGIEGGRNAALMAAAPDLLAALREALQSLEYIERTHPEVTGGLKRWTDIDRARAAIDKAEAV